MGESVRVPLRELLPADSPRLAGEDADHVRTLAEAEAEKPPIIVHRSTMRVIDGMHRLRAAAARGEDEIAVRFFDGDLKEAFILAVRANINHGMPLSFADRTAAAGRIILSHPNWSDRAIARTVGISAKSVSKVRFKMLGESTQVAGRIGADGRERPVNSSPDGRLRAAEFLANNPDASLREAAAVADVSVSTVNDVRNRLHRGEDPVLPSQRGTVESSTADAPAASGRSRPERRDDPARSGLGILQHLTQDPSLRFSEPGRDLLRVLHLTAVSSVKWPTLIGAIPDHQVGVVADLVEEFAIQWKDLAEQIRSKACATPHAAAETGADSACVRPSGDR
ncbi:ParB-like nuclease family protein [Actinokineospora spheciospongiae]|nr:ParB-like nuclease family protein [Actinokineospora spheciospongiae]